MTKILFLGDVHGKNKSPLNRLKDYNDDLFAKLQWIVDYCNKERVDFCIHLGDIHDRTEASDEWKNRFIQTWQGCFASFYTIFGNHDIPYNNEQFYPKTCLRNLELSNAVKIFKEPMAFNGKMRIVPLSLDLTKAKQELYEYCNDSLATTMHTIFVGHHYYEFDLNRNAGFVEEDFASIPVRADLVLGHDHRQHNTIFANNIQIFRPGSLMRTELSESTINMKPRVLLYDTEDVIGWKYIEVPHRDINEIYDVELYYSKKSNAKYFKQTSNALENMHKYLDKKSDTSILCSEALKQLNCPQPEFDYLKAAYQQCGQEF